MAKQLFKNNAATVMSGTLSQGGTTLVVAAGTGDRFPSPTGGDYFLATLFEKDEVGAETRHEVVRCTARTADTLTLDRDAEAMTGQAGGFGYPSSAGKTVFFELRWTAGCAENLLQSSDPLNMRLPATGKALPVDADFVVLSDTAADGVLKRLTWANIKAALAAAVQTLTNKTLINPTITNYTETRYRPAAAGTAFTLDFANGSIQRFTTSGNLTITLPASVDGKSCTVEVLYGGAHTVTFAGGTLIKHAGGTPTSPTSVAGKIDRWCVSQDGESTLISDGGRAI